MTPWPDIRTKKAELDRLLARHPRVCDHLDAWYDVELTYTSNAIEGNTLTRQETALVVTEGLSPKSKPLRDVDEARDHWEALALARRRAATDALFGEAFAQALHAGVTRRTLPDEAGTYSKHRRRVAGASVVFPNPAKLPQLMTEFGDWLSQQPADPEAAIEAHWRLVAIHPFSDGNGRTSRLLMNAMLFRAGYPGLVVGPDHRIDYIEALNERHMSGDAEPYTTFMAGRLSAVLDDYIETARDVREEEA